MLLLCVDVVVVMCEYCFNVKIVFNVFILLLVGIDVVVIVDFVMCC